MPITFNGKYQYVVKNVKKIPKGNKVFTSFAVTDINKKEKFKKNKGFYDLNIFHDGDVDVLDGDKIVFHECQQIQQSTSPSGYNYVTVNADFEIVERVEEKEESNTAEEGYW